MDRHDYVRRLIKKRNKKQQKVDKLSKEVQKLEDEKSFYLKRTFDSITDRFKIKECRETCGSLDPLVINHTHCLSSVYVCEDTWTPNNIIYNLPEEEQVSDEAIAKLHESILLLKNALSSKKDTIDSLSAEIEKLKEQDFVSWIQNQPKEFKLD